MPETFAPTQLKDLQETVAWVAGEGASLDLFGNGTKDGLGRPREGIHALSLSRMSGIILYEPEELILSAAAGTPLATIEEELGKAHQRLAFEPADYGPLYGHEAGKATIGGVIACNLSGPGRIAAGAARDHFLGFKAVNGRGEIFKSGGRVMKNVTGYDLCKLMAGSYGTLAALGEVTLKVLPAPEETATLCLTGLGAIEALAAMTAALQSPYNVSGAAHLPGEVAKASAVAAIGGAGSSVSALRLEGPAASVKARAASLQSLLNDMGTSAILETSDSVLLWREIRDVTPFHGSPEKPLWRICLPPSVGAAMMDRICEEMDGSLYYDWGGGLIWLSLGIAGTGDAGAGIIRKILKERGVDMSGHAVLFRGNPSLRSMVPVFEPLSPELLALTKNIKNSFDPGRIFSPGRMYQDV